MTRTAAGERSAAANPLEVKGQRVLRSMLLVLMCCVSANCQSIEPGSSTLERMQTRVTPAPPDRVSPPSEQARAKAAMVRWLERYLGEEYRVTDRRFVLTQPGFTESSIFGSKARQYVEQTLGGVTRPDTWLDDDDYSLLFWTFGDDSPRCIAFVMTNQFLPGTRKRSLVGYFELAPSPKR